MFVWLLLVVAISQTLKMSVRWLSRHTADREFRNIRFGLFLFSVNYWRNTQLNHRTKRVVSTQSMMTQETVLGRCRPSLWPILVMDIMWSWTKCDLYQWSRWIHPSNDILGNRNSTRNKFEKKKFWARFYCNFPRSFACALNRFDATVEWIPMNFLRFSGHFLIQVVPKIDFAPRAIRILICWNQRW